jgi:alpha-galactosidase
MMDATGYFMTESSGHLSEYLPYYRKRQELLTQFRGAESFHNSLLHGEVLRFDGAEAERVEKRLQRVINRNKLTLKKYPSDEYVSHIMNAMETNHPFRFNGNTINKNAGLITNLPKNSCVEIPIFVDYHGLHPQGGIVLPTICQALCNSNIMVQKAAVEGVLELDKEKIYHAVLLDPNTASVCSPKEIRDMVEDLFEAEKAWLPKF